MKLLLSLLVALSTTAMAQDKSPWKIEEWKKTPTVKWLDRDSAIRSLTYESEPFQGRTTDVFAFYATPGSIKGGSTRESDLPAVVLIHGGGGTAFAEWVWLWANRGYAAIAMDLSGRRPAAPKFDPKSGELLPVRRAPRTRLERGGPEADHVSKFDNVGGDITDDWQYHTVAAVMRAHSLIRSFPEVDSNRTAVTGISWGGYMTCLAASLDDRFKAAVPVYGCGFSTTASLFKNRSSTGSAMTNAASGFAFTTHPSGCQSVEFRFCLLTEQTTNTIH